MASVVITEGIMIVASLVIATALSGAVMTKVGVFQSAFTSASETQKDITLTQIKIIYATNSSSTKINIYVKNVGATPIAGLSLVDVYFGQVHAAQKIPYNSTTPTWIFANPISVWNIKTTTEIDINNGIPLQKNTMYMIRVSAPNGVSDDYFFST